MKALVKTKKGKGFVEIREVPIPDIEDNEVLIEVRACGICGTDLHIYNDKFPYWPPVILGHEFAGIIVDVGQDVRDWKVGDKVVGEPHTLSCGKCYLCRTGNPQLCSDKRSPGWGIDGAFAKYMRWPNPHLLHRIPETLSFENGTLVEPLSNVVSDILLTGSVKAADTVVIAGPGPIGIMAAILSKHIGAGRVIVLGTDDDEAFRLQFCRSLPEIDDVINVQNENVFRRIERNISKRGVDTYIEASGSASAIELGAKLVRKMGTFTAIGLTGLKKIKFPYDTFMKKAVKVHFNMSTKYDSWDRAISLISKENIPVSSLLTHQVKITEWKQVFNDLISRRGIKGTFYF